MQKYIIKNYLVILKEIYIFKYNNNYSSYVKKKNKK